MFVGLSRLLRGSESGDLGCAPLLDISRLEKGHLHKSELANLRANTKQRLKAV